MFKKLLNLESTFSVPKAAFIVGFFTLISKAVALFRDPLILSRIGVNDTTDIYFSAFRIPDFIFQLLVLGTLSVAFIPVFTEWILTDKQRAYRIANSVFNFSVLAMAVVCLILLTFAAPLTKILVPGFSGEKLQRTIQLMRLFLLSPVIFTASNIFTSVLSSYKKFIFLSIAPIMYNLGIIGGLLFLYPHLGLLGLGFGVIAGALMHLLVQIPEAIRQGWRWQAVMDLRDPSVRKIGKLFLPRIIGMDISQVSLIIGTTVGSLLAAGSVTIFTGANNLEAAPLGVFALSIATASFPLLSELYAKKDGAAFISALGKNISNVLFFIIPMAVLMVIYRTPIIRLIFGHGKFNTQDTTAMFTTFGILTFSLIGQSLSPLFSRAFYARHNTKTPVMVNIVSIIVDAILAFTLGRQFGLVGIAWGFAIACTLDATLMFIFFRRHIKREYISLDNFDRSLLQFLRKIIVSTVAMGVVSYEAVYWLGSFVNARTTIALLIESGGTILLGLIVFVSISYYLGLEQTKKTIDFLIKRW